MDDRTLVLSLLRLGAAARSADVDGYANPSADPPLSSVSAATLASCLEKLGSHHLIGQVKPYFSRKGEGSFKYQVTEKAATLVNNSDEMESFLDTLFPPPSITPTIALPSFTEGEVLTAAKLNKLVQAIEGMSSSSQHSLKDEDHGAITAFPLFNRRIIAPDDSLVFTLMPFTASWSEYVWRKEIKTIVENIPGYNLRCMRADDLYGADVMQDIYESIVSARIVIADITGRNANVFYELGIAHTIGKEVILLAQGTEHIPFDLTRFRHCIYSNDGSGYQVLRGYIPEAIKSILRTTLKKVSGRDV